MKITEFNPETGETEIYEEHGDEYTIASFQDIEPILEANIRDYNSVPHNILELGVEFRHEARIPMKWLEKLRNEEGLDFMNPEHMKVIKKRYLNNSEYRKFRTRPGKL